MFTTDGNSAVQPQLELLDLSLNTIDRATGERFVTLRATDPAQRHLHRARQQPQPEYLRRLQPAPDQHARQTPISAQTVSYNNQYKGAISDEQPLSFYRFSGKTGELVTIAMNASAIIGATSTPT